MRLRLLAGSAGLTALVVLAGCAPGATPTEPAYDSRIKVDTPALRQAKAEAGIEPCAGSSGETRSDLPQVTLPCLGGGKDVDLASVEGPAVVSVWAQWCTPCRKELPLYQRLADSGAVSVLGVDFKETSPTGAIGLLDATGAEVGS